MEVTARVIFGPRHGAVSSVPLGATSTSLRVKSSKWELFIEIH